MSLSAGSSGSSSPDCAALGDALALLGVVADGAAGSSEDGERIAAVATALARLAGLPDPDVEALYFASLLRNAGALENAALRKAELQTDRERMMDLWDVPPQGARLCAKIASLPRPTSDLVRWQSESWDGTGIPDQLRWSGIPAPAQLLRLARDFTAAAEPEEALASIISGSGTTFGPEYTRLFAQWYNATGGMAAPAERPLHALMPERFGADDVLRLIAGAASGT
jgi:response regulator RpfG family c-di-GMP phosphodiesterase